ncbi:cupin domain-containing protein [Massilia sp. METH4]|uniref:(R)-mandelonitrile lyase n=1 Tax=Massilia sp. METH4 TaxID=3123041 RepID=UPI0030CEDDDD
MKHSLFSPSVIPKGILIGAALIALQYGSAAAQDNAQSIARAGSQTASAGPAENFTGQVRVEPLWPSSAGISASGAYVTFEPGARSAWHVHPSGQRLVVTAGHGLTQEWGKPVQQLYAGDVVWCPPGIKHWHGAAPGASMTHLAVTGMADGKGVNWLEKVSDEQYRGR